MFEKIRIRIYLHTHLLLFRFFFVFKNMCVLSCTCIGMQKYNLNFLCHFITTFELYQLSLERHISRRLWNFFFLSIDWILRMVASLIIQRHLRHPTKNMCCRLSFSMCDWKAFYRGSHVSIRRQMALSVWCRLISMGNKKS